MTVNTQQTRRVKILRKLPPSNKDSSKIKSLEKNPVKKGNPNNLKLEIKKGHKDSRYS